MLLKFIAISVIYYNIISLYKIGLGILSALGVLCKSEQACDRNSGTVDKRAKGGEKGKEGRGGMGEQGRERERKGEKGREE